MESDRAESWETGKGKQSHLFIWVRFHPINHRVLSRRYKACEQYAKEHFKNL